MRELCVRDILDSVGGILENGSDEMVVKGVSTDTRKIGPEDLFFALKGITDGHQYVEKAYDAGCGAVVVSEPVAFREGIPVIRVEDTLKALQKLAKDYLEKKTLKKVAVTGSTGKTTTKEILYTLLSAKYKTSKNIGNFNNHIGLPLTVFTVEEYHEVGIFEMGMSGLSEIDLMADIVKPEFAVITNVGLSHIERLGSRENILKAKMEVAEHLTDGGKLILFDDNDLLHTVSDEGKSWTLIRVGSTEACPYRILEIDDSLESSVKFQMEIQGNLWEMELPAAGKHNAYNGALAIAAACEMGLSPELCRDALLDFEQEAGKRLDVKKLRDGIKVIDDTYNASPDSMKAGLSVLKTVKGKRKIAILGDMFEMGDYAGKYHEEVGMFAASQGIDMIMTIGKDAVLICKGAEGKLPPESCMHFEEKEALLKKLDEILKPEDVLLVKGSRGMHMEDVVEFLQKNRSE